MRYVTIKIPATYNEEDVNLLVKMLKSYGINLKETLGDNVEAKDDLDYNLGYGAGYSEGYDSGRVDGSNESY